MVYVLADNIISPLGTTSEENYLAAKAGKSGIHAYKPGTLGIPEGFTASWMASDFEEMAFESAQKALSASGVNGSKARVVFILSSTKGDIEKLSDQDGDILEYGLSASAKRIASKLGISTQPIVVCNACISGLSAVILGERLIDMKRYDYAVICGCDVPGRFIISGFQSLRALSSEPCRPFDMERFGLNLGVASATLILGREKPNENAWQLGQGFVKNDAFHISAPSKIAEGLYDSLAETLNLSDTQEKLGISEAISWSEELALINAHGTATLFNDQMESIAIQRANLSDIPTNALKGYWGHTLGAAGILETILCMKELDEHTIIGTKGFQELGVSGKVNVSAQNQSSEKETFIKMLSGFGGCNATLLGTKKCSLQKGDDISSKTCTLAKNHSVSITPSRVSIDGKALEVALSGNSLLTSIYKQYIGDYPKYYKMDGLSRLGFIASELLLKAEKDSNCLMDETRQNASKHEVDRAIILFNHSSSIASDKKFLESIADKDHYFPSPSVFVYTLPNIVTGEIAIRNGYHGETSFYILENKDEELIQTILEASFLDPQTESIIGGWLNYDDDSHFEAEMYLYEKRG